MNASELIDSMIVEMNQSIGKLVSGNYMGWMNDQLGVLNKLLALKKSIGQDSGEEGVEKINGI